MLFRSYPGKDSGPRSTPPRARGLQTILVPDRISGRALLSARIPAATVNRKRLNAGLRCSHAATWELLPLLPSGGHGQAATGFRKIWAQQGHLWPLWPRSRDTPAAFVPQKGDSGLPPASIAAFSNHRHPRPSWDPRWGVGSRSRTPRPAEAAQRWAPLTPPSGSQINTVDQPDLRPIKNPGCK